MDHKNYSYLFAALLLFLCLLSQPSYSADFIEEDTESAVTARDLTIEDCFYDPKFTGVKTGDDPGAGEDRTATIDGQYIAAELKKKGFTKRIVGCVQLLFFRVGGDEVNDIRQGLASFVRALVTLFVATFFIRVALGDVRNVGGDMVKNVSLAIMVFYFTGIGLEKFLIFFLYAQNALVEAVFTATVFADGFTEDNGCVMQYFSSGGGETAIINSDRSIWESLDCTMAQFFGYDIITDNFTGGSFADDLSNLPFDPRTSDSNMMLNTATGLMFTSMGFVGIVLLLIIFFYIVSAMVQAIFTYIICFAALIFLALIAPIIIPFVLFQITRPVFDEYFQMVLGYTLIPMILFAYLAFSIQILLFGIIGFEGGAGGSICDRMNTQLGGPDACGTSIDGIEDPYGSVFGVKPYLELAYEALTDPEAENRETIITIEGITERDNPEEMAEHGLAVNPERYSEIITVPQIDFKEAPGAAAYNNELEAAKGECDSLYSEPEEQEACRNFLENQKLDSENIGHRFLQSLFALGLLTAILAGFTRNVVMFANRLAGVSIVADSRQMGFIYNSIQSRVAESMKK